MKSELRGTSHREPVQGFRSLAKILGEASGGF